MGDHTAAAAEDSVLDPAAAPNNETNGEPELVSGGVEPPDAQAVSYTHLLRFIA